MLNIRYTNTYMYMYIMYVTVHTNVLSVSIITFRIKRYISIMYVCVVDMRNINTKAYYAHKSVCVVFKL